MQDLRVVLAAMLCLAFPFRQALGFGPITGTVTDSITGEKLSGVTVSVRSYGDQVITGSDGNFTLVSSTGIAGRPYPSEAVPDAERYSIYTPAGKRLAFLGNARSMVGRLPDGIYILEGERSGRLLKVMKSGGLVNISYPCPRPSGQTARGKAAAVTITLEAETMSLNGYVVESNRIQVDPNLGTGASGTATASFTGGNGIYTVSVTGIPENDGAPTVKLYIGGRLVLDQQYPMDAKYYKLTDTETWTVAGITINTNDEIKLVGTADAEAWARVDRLTFADGMDVTLEFSKTGYISRTVNTRWGSTLNIALTPLPSGEAPVSHGQFINAQNTGCRIPEDQLKVLEGDVELQWPNQVLQGRLIKGNLTISADNITVVDCIIHPGGVYVLNQAKGFRMEWTEVDAAGREGVLVNFKSGDRPFIRRCNIHHSWDLFRWSDYGVEMQECYLHYWGTWTTTAHADCIQVLSPLLPGEKAIINKCNLFNPLDDPNWGNAGIGINGVGIGGIGEWIVTNNRMSGCGYFIHFSGSGFVFNNNIMGPHKYGYWRVYNDAQPKQFDGNVNHEGVPLPWNK